MLYKKAKKLSAILAHILGEIIETSVDIDIEKDVIDKETCDKNNKF